MARIDEILVGRYNRLFQKLFQIKGSGPRPTVMPEIGGQIQLFHGSENRYLEGWERFGFSVSFAAGGVGNINHLRIRNPVPSRVVAVLEKVFIGNGATSDTPFFEQGAGITDFAAVASPAPFDIRGRPGSAMIVSSQQAAAAGAGSTRLNPTMLSNSILDIISTDIQEIPLLPGTLAQLRGTSANIVQNFAFWWRERALEESELT